MHNEALQDIKGELRKRYGVLQSITEHYGALSDVTECYRSVMQNINFAHDYIVIGF